MSGRPRRRPWTRGSPGFPLKHRTIGTRPTTPDDSAVDLDSVESVSVATPTERLGPLSGGRMLQIRRTPAVAVDCDSGPSNQTHRHIGCIGVAVATPGWRRLDICVRDVLGRTDLLQRFGRS
jgi:hypothetical protein